MSHFISLFYFHFNGEIYFFFMISIIEPLFKRYKYEHRKTLFYYSMVCGIKGCFLSIGG